MKKTKPALATNKKSPALTATQLISVIKSHSSEEERKKLSSYFKSGEGQYGEGDVFIGVRMGTVFSLAKDHIEMPLEEIEKLLENPIHEVRTAGLSIMNQQARKNKLPESQRKELYDLYLRRHDRINNWDLVDVSCIHVIGRYLFDKPRNILYKLARSKNIWERRTAIVSTAYFIKYGQITDSFNIAEILLGDKEDLIHKATGGWIRHAGAKEPHRATLLSFLDKHAARMPRTMLRYAIEHLDAARKKHYLELKQKKQD